MSAGLAALLLFFGILAAIGIAWGAVWLWARHEGWTDEEIEL